MRLLIGMACYLVLVSSHAAAADWGRLQMRFAYDGEPPLKSDTANGVGTPRDESLLVNERDRGLQNVCVWLLPSGNDPLPVHPTYGDRAAGKVAVKLVGGRFEPRAAHVQRTQTLAIANSDQVGYSLCVQGANNDAFCELLHPGESFQRRFEFLENSPLRLTAAIQPGLNGYVIVSDNPYAAVSDEHGTLSLPNVPAGRWSFAFWHERSGYLKKVINNGHTYELTRGQSTLTISSGDNDLGELKLPPEQFKR